VKPWARIDCDFFDNPKIAALAPRDQITYLKIILWCKVREAAHRRADPAGHSVPHVRRAGA